ncbi:MAG TPA: cache domain-containing protein [Desulfomonilaceae bacterium]|nr:cache domain-containing protein [Desulfomonilaceae bacterium]
MRFMRLSTVSLMLLLSVASSVLADQSQDVENLVQQAVQMFNDKGRDATLSAINDKRGPLVKGDLYVFALTMENLLVAQPYEHTLRKMNLSNTQDARGVYIFKKFQEVVEKQGSGWVEYMWAKPGEKDPSPKRSYLKKVPGENLYVGAGYYVPQHAADK